MASTTTKKKTPPETPAAPEVKGICLNCNHVPTCTHRARNRDVAIYECEDYDGATVAVIRPHAATAEPDYGEFKGLCMNCADREICRFPKPEGGVWHCHEYRAE